MMVADQTPLADERMIVRDLLHAIIEELKAPMPRFISMRDQNILRDRVGFHDGRLGGVWPMTLDEIGRRAGVNRERARQLLIKARQRLYGGLSEAGYV